ncbi:MAG: hypothetical protein EAX90_12175 [Candidatus Heimdallarchaeota archaeon]|nr:hypothetical protein [Candidatus Heimdallarchaeota archaeon]
MSSEEEIIEELVFALRRDFKIRKEIISALSKIGAGVIPHLINAFKLDDFAFQLKIIETLGKMGEIGSPGLVELLDYADIKTKISILKTIREMNERAIETNNMIIDKMEKLIDWDYIEFKSDNELTDQIDNLILYRDNLVKTILKINKLVINSELVDEIAFITFHFYLRKIQNQEIKDNIKYLYSKLKEGKKINLLELEELYKSLFQVDCLFREIFSLYLKRYSSNIGNDAIEKLLSIVGEQLPRELLKNYCGKNFYLFNYESVQLDNYANHSLYLRMIYLFTKERLDTLSNIDNNIKGIITELQQNLVDEEIDDIYIFDTIEDICQQRDKVNKEVKNIDVTGYHLGSIDLKPLSECLKLENLNLRDNQLKEINLEPLQKCKELESLNIAYNQLTTIDLKPLLTNTKLKWLILKNNCLSEIDLKPLQTNTNLIELDLSNNELKSIDLTPLENCKELEFLEIDDMTELLWQKSTLPKEEYLPLGIRDYYPRIKISK